MLSRRRFLGQFAGAAVGVRFARPAFTDGWQAVVGDALPHVDGRSAQELANDEDFWAQIQNAFAVDRTIINLNNAGVSPSPRVVQDAMAHYLAYTNEAPPYTMWTVLEPQVESVRQQLAREFGCDPEEMAITRNASESLEIVQLGMDLKPGDEVLTTDQDYPRMLTTWDQRARRQGITLRKVAFPVPPASMDSLVSLFEDAIGLRTRVIHCCHITNLTGQIFPIREIVEMARPKGIEVVVDGAQAFAHFPFKRDDLDCDYYGTSLHKWLFAPIGTGFLYVRREKIEKIWPLMPAPASMSRNIRKFEEIGTHPAANHNAIAEAITFHQTVGAERKAARLRYLRDRWMKRLAENPRVRVNTSFAPEMSCGIANIGVKGVEPAALSDRLWSTHRILVVPMVHPEFSGIRVTASVYTTLEEVDTFAEAVEAIIRQT